MFRTFLTAVAAIAFLGQTAVAQECSNFSSEYGALVFDEPMSVVVTIDGADAVKCQLFGTGTGQSTLRADCGDGQDWALFTASSTQGGSDHDIVVFQNTVWYRECAQ
jgi:hypothetical protein